MVLTFEAVDDPKSYHATVLSCGAIWEHDEIIMKLCRVWFQLVFIVELDKGERSLKVVEHCNL